MQPFQNRGEKTWLLKVQDSDGRWHNKSTGTRDEATAIQIAKLVDQWRDEHKWELLDAIAIKGTIKLKDVMRYRSKVTKTTHHGGRKEKRSEAAVADEILRRATDLTLSQWLDAWASDTFVTKYRGVAAKPTQKKRYVSQLREEFIPPGSPLTVDWIADPENVQKALDALSVGNETRRHYRVAISQFCKFLLRKKVLTFNPVAEGRVAIVFTKEELEARKTPLFYTEEQVRKLLAWTPTPRELRKQVPAVFPAWRAMTALMAGSGLEFGVVAKLTPADFNFATRIITAEGTKNGYRNRMVGVVADDCWTIVERYVKGLAPTQPFLPRARAGKSSQVQMSVLYHIQALACAATGVENLKFHKHRHGFTVAYYDKLGKRMVQDQLGHAPNSNVIDTHYGKHTAQQKLEERMKELIAEIPAPLPPDKREGKRKRHLHVA